MNQFDDPKTTVNEANKITVGLYVRISCKDKNQTTENQLQQLKQYCERMSYNVVDVYEDHVTGSTSERSEFKRLFADAAQRKFDICLFWSLDRFSRQGARETIHYLELLESYGVAFKSFTEQYLDTCGIFKDVVISMLASMAKQERIRLSERVKAGLERSNKKGGRPKLDIHINWQMDELKSQGLSNRKIASELGVGRSTVNRHFSKAA